MKLIFFASYQDLLNSHLVIGKHWDTHVALYMHNVCLHKSETILVYLLIESRKTQFYKLNILVRCHCLPFNLCTEFLL
jgi:hypothetical protein